MAKLKKILGCTVVCFICIFMFASFCYAKEGRVIASDSNLRQKASTGSKVLKTLAKGCMVEILQTSNGWYQIKVKGEIGWIYAKLVSVVESQVCVINANNLNFRHSPGGAIITTLAKGSNASILDTSNGWCKIKTSSGTVGWVSKKFVSNVSSNKKIASRGETYTTDTSIRQRIVNYAKAFLGVKYVYGGMSPGGFDCSGFVKYVYNHFGISLNRVAASQANQGYNTNRNESLPGDLMFFDTDGNRNYVNHVGIFIGDNKFIHASSGRSAHRVVISGMTDFYENSFMRVKRVVD